VARTRALAGARRLGRHLPRELILWRDFDRTTAAMQFVEREPWIGAFNAWYHLGVDGISMPLIVLTASSRRWW